jgi:radical SAM superfamily enzyme YgiQ (UPF0313 family)
MNHTLLFSVHSIGLRRPSGPYRIATILRDNNWDVEVVEYSFYFTLDELKEFTRSRVTANTLFIGFSCFFYVWNQTLDDFVSWLKSEYPSIKLIIGGQSRQITQTKNIDYYVHGYGERAILEIIKNIVGNSSKLSLDPMFFGSKKVITANESYPAFPLKSLRIKYEERDDILPWEWLTIEFARGCIFSCAYCNFPILGVKEDHTRDAEDFKEEIKENYERWGVTHYYVADETFNDHSEKIVKYANAISELGINTTFTGFVRGDLVVARKQDWDPLATLGFWGQFYGIETMNQPTAKAIGKGMNTAKLQDGLLEARNYFKQRGPYRGSMGIVVGLPHETIETQMATFDWIDKNWKGESAHVWPLEIATDPTIDKLSKMGKDYAKFGYSVSDVLPEEMPEQLRAVGNQESRIKHMISCMNWKNENMNYATACKIADDWTMKVLNKQYDMGVCAFALGYYVGENSTLEHAVDNCKEYDQIPFDHDARIQSYIKKKLS